MKQFPFTTSFAKLVIKPMVSQERDKYLAMASLEEISKFVPNIDTVSNSDLLPVAFNACVVNRVNKNTDVIDTKTALAMYKNFVNKPINVEHQRQKVIGMIVSAGFTAFGSDKPLSEEEVAKMEAPFNIVLGGVVWRTVAPDLSDLIEEASDPTSTSYGEVSASWELGFSGYRIALMEGGKKNLSEASQIIEDPKEVEKAQNKLVALGGDGKFNDLFAYRMPSFDVLPLGIGFTEKPAAEVKGIATQTTVEAVKEEAEKIVGQPNTPAFAECQASEHWVTVCSCGEVLDQCRCMSTAKEKRVKENGCAKCANKISQSSIKDVNSHRNTKTMKITAITDISEASVKDVTPSALASAVSDFIQTSLTEKSKEFEKQKGELTNKAATAETTANEAKAELVKVNEKVKELTSQVETFAKEKKDREAVEKFNARMNEVTASYDLDDEVRAAIVEEVKSIESDEAWTKWQSKAKAILKPFAKKDDKAKKDAKCKAGEDGDADDAEAKKSKAAEAKASTEAVVEGAKDAKGGVPNGTTGTQSLMDKAKLAFAKENMTFSR